MRLVTPEEEYQFTKLTLTFSRARATVQDRRWLRRLKRREEPPTDKTEHPALAWRGWVKRFYTFSILGCLSFSILLSFYPFLMCPYPIRWFPVPSVIAPSPRSPILSGICQCTRRLGFGCIFLFWCRTMVKPYSCVVCGWRFHLLHNMQRHLATHKTQDKVPRTKN